KQKRSKRLQALNVGAARAACARVSVIEAELPRLVIVLETVIFAIDSHLAAEFQRVFVHCPVPHGGHEVAVDRTKLVRVAIAKGGTSARRAGEIETRKSPDVCGNHIVVRGWEAERS